MIDTEVTIETIKRKYSLIVDKKAFREELAIELKYNFDYLTMNFFQKNWKLPPEHYAYTNKKLDNWISEQINEMQNA